MVCDFQYVVTSTQFSTGAKTVMDEETLTAYHESGHAVIGYALGGTVQGMQLGGEEDDWLPARFGDCRIHWGRVDPNVDWQRKREILTVLAGPVAEMVYREESYHPAVFGPWKHDWELAWCTATPMWGDERQRMRGLESIIVELKRRIQLEQIWAGGAARADELVAHEMLEEERIEDVLSFWCR